MLAKSLMDFLKCFLKKRDNKKRIRTPKAFYEKTKNCFALDIGESAPEFIGQGILNQSTTIVLDFEIATAICDCIVMILKAKKLNL
jgi:hypothetical protein